MGGLERLRLTAQRTEASSLLSIPSVSILEALDASAAWWICHDEGDLDVMVSIVIERDGDWVTQEVDLAPTSGGRHTDAEALARIDDQIFVFGSSFADKHGDVDDRRAFVARFSEAVAVGGPADTEVLDLGTLWRDHFDETLTFDTLATDHSDALVNVEGATFHNGDLVLGLRWPVSATGQPILMRIHGAAQTLTKPAWSVHELRTHSVSLHCVDVGASAKRPSGVRGLTTAEGELHLVTGQTERGLAARKVKAGPAVHVQLTGPLGGRLLETRRVERFEGFRRVEGLAPHPGGGWLYALDDEDAVVLVSAAL